MIYLANKVTRYMVKNNIIFDEDVYLYGFAIILNYALGCFTILLISFWLGKFAEGILYILFFGYIREYAGGYHASSYLACYLSFVFLYGVGLFMVNLNIQVLELIGFISAILLIFLCPVEHPNKPLSKNEIEVYREKNAERVLLSIVVALVLNLIQMELSKMIYIVFSFSFLLAMIQLKLNSQSTRKGIS